MVRDLIQAEVRDIGDGYSQFRGVGDRYVVEADAISADDSASYRNVKCFCRKSLPTRENRIDIFCQCDQFVRVTALRHDEFGIDRAEDCSLDLERGPSIISYQHSPGRHSLR